MFGDRFSSSTSCSRWVHETEPDRPDPSLTCCFLKVATHPYHVIPFARSDELFRDDVLRFGNVLHRLRVPFRVNEAADMARRGVMIEAFDQLGIATKWVKAYALRAKSA